MALAGMRAAILELDCKNRFGKPVLLFVAHVDTVEDGKKKIKPLLKKGTIYSDQKTILGADDKAGVTALLGAAKKN